METSVPELPPEQAEVVAWLRSPQGEEWSIIRRARAARVAQGARGITRHTTGSGLLAEILPCPAGPGARMGPPQ